MSVVSELVSGGVKGILDSFTKAVQVFKADATQGAQLDAALDQAKADLLTLAMQVEEMTIQSVNATIQAEVAAKQEHWLQWAWRPLNGMVLAVGSFSTLMFVFYCAIVAIHYGRPDALTALPNIITAVGMVLSIPGAVCGVTAWYRGRTQLKQTQGG